MDCEEVFMNHDVRLNKFFATDTENLFKYFINPELLEKWAYPDGMSLRIPEFEAQAGGQYRYEHTGDDGVYVCSGHIKDLVPGKKLVQLDEKIVAPNGEKLFENLESILEFSPQFGGTEISMIQTGFTNQEAANECHIGWTQCLNHLTHLITQARIIPSDIGREASL
jgi:uncharacterized protein YndB with AHSA1/START domain